MSNNKIKETARIYALQNAIQFNGKANPKSVIGKVIAVLQKDGISPKKIIPVVNIVVNEINKIELKKQIKELEKIAPLLLIKEKKERDFSLPELPNAINGKVVTRFPPEPNGYLHIGHAKAAIVDYEYAKKYNGKFILRFDDTNPENENIEFYNVQKEDLKWLGIEWDIEYNTSDNLKKHYKLAEQLINQENAYVCRCSTATFKELRFKGIECNCRDNSIETNLSLWKDMHNYLDNAVLRLKGDMKNINSAMRDPTLFRVVTKNHPIQKDKYRVWPTYDFSGAIEDSISGVTHPFRTKEYELRDEVYFQLLELLNLRKPNLLEFARLSIDGMPVSKRKIKPLIDNHLVSGYNDIRLPTIRGLKKRGIIPEAIKKFVISQGISKVESLLSFSLLTSENKKIIDPIVKRFFFVKDPIKLIVENAPEKTKEINFHPSNKQLGSRKIKTNKIFYIQKSDIKDFNKGDFFRLKDLFNVEIINKNKKINGNFIGENLIPESLKIQWTTEDYIKMEIHVPQLLFIKENFNKNSLKIIKGFAESSIKTINDGEIIQFERFGFVRIEKDKEKITGYFAHK